MSTPETPILEGQHVRLEPLRPHHLDQLERIALDEQTWKFMVAPLLTRADLEHWAEHGWEQERLGKMMVWVTYAKNADGSETLAGGTRFMDVNLKDRNVEIGNSWIIPELRGTKVNAEAKYLQLRYGFETLGLERIALKAHAANLRSQAAIKGLGAKYEGTFRRHMIMPDGSYRDSAWFSIIREEWPETKDTLERRLRAPLP
ncbi:MAG: GNAT family protein [Acidobacteriaceae bacterium]|nr:GNAT family protein [Acidobacteriaceae bacterium]